MGTDSRVAASVPLVRNFYDSEQAVIDAVQH
jgi:hypothetical protein